MCGGGERVREGKGKGSEGKEGGGVTAFASLLALVLVLVLVRCNWCKGLLLHHSRQLLNTDMLLRQCACLPFVAGIPHLHGGESPAKPVARRTQQQLQRPSKTRIRSQKPAVCLWWLAAMRAAAAVAAAGSSPWGDCYWPACTAAPPAHNCAESVSQLECHGSFLAWALGSGVWWAGTERATRYCGGRCESVPTNVRIPVGGREGLYALAKSEEE